MKTFLLLMITVCATQFFLPRAQAQEAGVIAFPSLTYTAETGAITGDQDVLDFNFRGGYLTPFGFYFGMTYLNNSGGGTNSINGSAIGNCVGFFTGSLSIIATYYLTAKMTENTPTYYVARTEGSGIQIDVAYTFPIGAGFTFGPMLTYQNMTYNKREDSSGYTNVASQTQTYFYPSLALTFEF